MNDFVQYQSYNAGLLLETTLPVGFRVMNVVTG
jgi:hypothetical protein